MKCLVIAAAVLWIYAPAFNGGWLGDDDILVSGNPVVRDAAGLWKIWFEPANYLIDYQPLKVSVIWLQWHLWGDRPLGYHLTNVALHMLGCLLVWRLLAKLGLRWAWLGGLLFAVHPVQVESVAWISELKNTLSLPLFLLAMICWIDFDERGRSRDAGLAFGFFLAAMLCKTTPVMFPVIILLYAWYRRGRVQARDLVGSAPFFAVSLALGVATLWFLKHHAIGESSIVVGAPLSRVALAGLTTAFYFSKCVLPVDLMPIYPRWPVDPPSLVQFLPWLVLAGLLAWLWNRRDGWGRPALLGIGFFLVNLVPFAGFVTGSYMAFSWVTDHTLYLPIIGLVGLAVAGLERLGGKLTPPARRLEFGAVALVLVLLATASHGYAQLYVSKKVLCEYAVARNPYAVPAQVALGAMALDESRVDEAIRHAEAAVDCDPVSSNAQVVLGCAYLRQGRIADAEAAFKKAVDLAPTDPGARTNLGEAMAKEGRFEDAIRQFDLVLRSHPAQADALAARGEARRCLGIYPGAWADLKEAVSLDPDAAQARISLGVLELARGELHPAIDDLRRARELAPVDPNADYAALWIWTARQKLGERADADRELGDSLDHHWNAKPDGFATKHAELLLGRIDAMDYSTTFSRSSSGWIESFYYTGVKLLVTPKIESIPQDTEKSGTTASAFLRVIRTAPPTFFEYTLALGELNQINWQ